MKKLLMISAVMVAFVSSSAQNVGIGTTSPANRLSVVGSVDITGNSGIGTSTFTAYGLSGTVRSFEIQNTGTGAGSTSALFLSTAALSGGIGGVYFAAPSISPGSKLMADMNASFETSGDAANPVGRLTFSVRNAASYATRMVITGSGNVGIGTSSPANRLSVSGSLDITGNSGIGTSTFSSYGLSGIVRSFEIQNTGTSPGSTAALFLSTQAVSGGMGGIYFTAPGLSSPIKLMSDINTNFDPSGDALNPVGKINFSVRNAGNYGIRMVLTGAGNVGIGNFNPSRPLSFPATLGEKILLYPGANGEVGIGVYGNELRLHSDNPGAAVSFGTQDNAGNFTQAGRFQINAPYALYVNGSIWANGTTYASDGRYKKNIEPLENSLDKIIHLQGVSYEMKAAEYPHEHFTEGTQVGLVAQEVEEVVPEVVITGPDGYKAVDYAKLVPLLIEAVKNQQQQIEELKRMIKPAKMKSKSF
jgi:hypothetical protein